MGKLRPAGQIRPAGPFILAHRHLHKLKLPPQIERKTFFPLEIMDGSDLKKKNKPQRSKIGIKSEKNEVKTLYFGDHIREWTVISKKKIFNLFSNQRAARGFNSFSKSGPSCEKSAHPCSNPFCNLFRCFHH